MFKLRITNLLFWRNLRELDLLHPKLKSMGCVVLPQRTVQTESVDNETETSLDNTSLEDEIEKKRNKNRLPDRVYRIYAQKEIPNLAMKYDFTKKRIQRHYGTHGKVTGINPGYLWPTKDELDDIIEFEKKYEPSLQEMLQNVQAEKAEREKAKKDYEDEVYKKMDNLDKTMQDFYAKIAKRQDIAEELKKKRELLIEDISEYLGYDVDPQDPKFKEAVDLRQKEKKKALKVKKEKESYTRMLQKLSEIADESKKS